MRLTERADRPSRRPRAIKRFGVAAAAAVMATVLPAAAASAQAEPRESSVREVQVEDSLRIFGPKVDIIEGLFGGGDKNEPEPPVGTGAPIDPCANKDQGGIGLDGLLGGLKGGDGFGDLDGLLGGLKGGDLDDLLGGLGGGKDLGGLDGLLGGGKDLGGLDGLLGGGKDLGGLDGLLGGLLGGGIAIGGKGLDGADGLPGIAVGGGKDIPQIGGGKNLGGLDGLLGGLLGGGLGIGGGKDLGGLGGLGGLLGGGIAIGGNGANGADGAPGIAVGGGKNVGALPQIGGGKIQVLPQIGGGKDFGGLFGFFGGKPLNNANLAAGLRSAGCDNVGGLGLDGLLGGLLGGIADVKADVVDVKVDLVDAKLDGIGGVKVDVPVDTGAPIDTGAPVDLCANKGQQGIDLGGLGGLLGGLKDFDLDGLFGGINVGGGIAKGQPGQPGQSVVIGGGGIDKGQGIDLGGLGGLLGGLKDFDLDGLFGGINVGGQGQAGQPGQPGQVVVGGGVQQGQVLVPKAGGFPVVGKGQVIVGGGIQKGQVLVPNAGGYVFGKKPVNNAALAAGFRSPGCADVGGLDLGGLFGDIDFGGFLCADVIIANAKKDFDPLAEGLIRELFPCDGVKQIPFNIDDFGINDLDLDDLLGDKGAVAAVAQLDAAPAASAAAVAPAAPAVQAEQVTIAAPIAAPVAALIEAGDVSVKSSGAMVGDVGISVSCLAANGRVDTNIVNHGSDLATYVVEFANLSPRSRVVEAGDWGRISISGRAEGNHSMHITRNGVTIVDTTVTVACDGDVQVSDAEVSVINACRDGNGYMLFQLVNSYDEARPYVIEFDNVSNRSVLAQGHGAAVRAVTGRPSGDHGYLVRVGGVVVDEGTVTVDC